MAKKHLRETICNAQTEEELKFAFVKYFNLPFSAKNRIDLYTEQILFEFKLDDNLKNIKVLAKTVAQALYYIRRLKLGDDDRSPSENICVVTKNLAAFFKTDDFAAFYSNVGYDWDLKPSAPCKILVNDLSDAEIILHAHVYDFDNYHEQLSFEVLINQTRKRQSALFNVKKQITAQNFYQIFRHWQTFFGDAVKNGHKPSEYFITDIEQNKSHIHEGKVYFELPGEQVKIKVVNPDEYNYFWNHYAKISSAREIIAIRQKMDCITEINLRRFTGEFYTPIDFAKKAFDYITRTVGEWWKSDNFRLWDMAAGTGNLEFALPPDALKFCYVSTLIEDEANYCRQLFSDATVFQFDFLNDDADKLPKNLRDDLNNPDIKWIIFINPPYATANDFQKKNFRGGISNTAIKQQMIAENIAESSRELMVQFLYRISKDFANRAAYLGIFSSLRYITTANDEKFRDKYFSYKFERGFMFSSQNFDGCNGKFPVGFIVWNLNERLPLHKQKIWLDVYDSGVEKFAEKKISSYRSEELLNHWVKRPPKIKKFPPMSSALKVGYENKVRCDVIAENFLAGLMSKGNDFSNQNGTAFLSGSYVSNHGMSVTPENFEQCMIIHMVRKLPKADWLNNKDQFMQPTKDLPREFICDAVVWSLFAPSNQTVSLRNVEYEGEIYRLKNNFYPFTLEELRRWDCSSLEIVRQTDSEVEDRFAATWLKNHELSAQAQDVLNAARELYKKFYAELNKLDVAKWKIYDWDAGWYQIRMSLGASLSLKALSDKLEPQIYEAGFLRDEVRYF